MSVYLFLLMYAAFCIMWKTASMLLASLVARIDHYIFWRDTYETPRDLALARADSYVLTYNFIMFAGILVFFILMGFKI